MCFVFDSCKINCFVNSYFRVISIDQSCIEVQSTKSYQYWKVRKINKVGYPKVVLYHKHTKQEQYHVHYSYADDNALKAVVEIINHDRYLLLRHANKSRSGIKSNRELLFWGR